MLCRGGCKRLREKRQCTASFGLAENTWEKGFPKEQVFPDPYNLIIIVYYLSRLMVAWSMDIYIIADKVNNLSAVRLLTFQS